MRGASALETLLGELPDEPVRVFVVWEPVLRSDIAAPLTRVLGLLRDRRVVQYWDPDRALSADLVRTVNENPSLYGFEEALPSDFIAWDVLAVFSTTARWERDVPVPAFYGGPVIAAIDDARTAIASELARVRSISE